MTKQVKNTSGWLMGLGGSDHDFSAALMRGTDIKVAIEQERISRRKHGTSLWFERPLQQAIDYCLKAEGISILDVETFVSSDLLPAQVRHEFKQLNFREFPHHLCHAASAYMMLPPGARAGVLVYDGYGSIRGGVEHDSLRNLRETFSHFLFTPDGYQCLGHTAGVGYREQDDFPTGVTNSIGMLYELITALLGYDPMDSGKTMGLSSHGTPKYLGHLEEFVEYGDEISNCFRCRSDDPNLVTVVERILLAGRGGFEVKADLAASLQALMNRTLVHCASFFRDQKIDYLCISGGCALNTVASTFLVENSPLTVPIIIPPHCGDSGIAFGALWLEEFSKSHTSPNLTFRGRSPSPGISRPGRSYSSAECHAAVQQSYPQLCLDSSVRGPADLARLIANGAIIGIFNGGSEIGPRALGGRSIIADPRSVMTREKINRLIKRREPFRPLAPIVLESDYPEYFIDSRCMDPFMLKVARTNERCLREAPAVVHVDGTARVQVIGDNDGDVFLVELLRAFREQTGTGVLLNTSFNRRGEPIVETPLDAIDAFLGMKLDGLFLEGEFYRPADSLVPMD